MPRLCPHRSPPRGVLSCSEGWPRLQEAGGLASSSRRAEKPRRKRGLVGVWVGQPCSSGASQKKLAPAPLLKAQTLAVCV